MTDDDLADVIQLPTRPKTATERDNRDADDRAELAITKPSYLTQAKACSHRSPLVDLKARTLTCTKCGVPLDPFMVLDQVATRNESLLAARRQIESSRDRAAAECREAERKATNAKSRLRTARRRSLEVDADAIRAAADAAKWFGLRWDDLSELQRASVLPRTQDIIEAYAAALEQ